MSATHANVLQLNTSSSSITAGAYVQLSSSIPISTTRITVTNSTAVIIQIAYGASGSEIAYCTIAATSQASFDVNYNIFKAGTRLAITSVDANVSTGWVVVSLMP